MLFDDYAWPTQQDPPEDPERRVTFVRPSSKTDPSHPKPGIDSFLAVKRSECEVVHTGYQMLLQRTSAGPHYAFPVECQQQLPVVFVVDESYARAAAVAVRSLLQHCSAPRCVRICIVDLGLSDDSRRKLQHCVNDVLNSGSNSSSSSASTSSSNTSSASEIYWIDECKGMNPRYETALFCYKYTQTFNTVARTTRARCTVALRHIAAYCFTAVLR
jgi:hypothetical protein